MTPASHDAIGRGDSVRLAILFVATACIVVSGLLSWLRPDQPALAQAAALAGAILAALPTVAGLITSIRSTGFSATRYYMDQYVVLALAACLATERYTSGAIVAIVLVFGQMLEERSTLGVDAAVSRLRSLARLRARRRTGDSHEEIDASELRSGDEVAIHAGETIPADAIVLSGHALVDQAAVTGESVPVEVAAGATVFAGTVNLNGALTARVSGTGRDTVMGRVQAIIEEAKTSTSPIISLAEDYARYYTPLILLIAACVFLFTQDLSRAIAVLVVSIPCAFVLASPSAMVAAISSASRMGMLVRSVRHLESARLIDTVVFDKTGTLTTGRMELEEVAIHAADWREEELLSLAAALESQSNHPVAKAITRLAGGSTLPVVDDFREHPGRGLEGIIGGKQLRIGRPSWLAGQGIKMADQAFSRHSIVALAIDGVHAATFLLAQSIRPEAAETLRLLRQLGIEDIRMVTGDREEVASHLASQLGIDQYLAACLPEDKVREIRRMKEAGRRVMVVGDGLNDAPALAESDLGIAMASEGNDVTVLTSDVALMSNDLRRIPDLLWLSQRTVSVVNQNLLCGMIFIALAILLSSAGWISPVAAAFFHEFSAFFVIFNGARLLRFRSIAEEMGAAGMFEEETRIPELSLQSGD